ncbi:MAG: alkaline phosphatase, partial [Bacteroidota bacterium]
IFNGKDSSYNATRDWVLPDPKVGVAIDVLLGGGSRQFLPKKTPGANNIVRDHSGNVLKYPKGDTVILGKGGRMDTVDLIEVAKSRGYKFVNSRDALNNLDLSQFTPNNNAKLIGLFRDSHCDYEQDRQMTYDWEPNLAEMTQIAIEVLKRKSDKGFFLMVEGGRIDHLEHANCGGIGFAAVDSTHRRYVVTSDKPAIAEDKDYNGDTTAIVPGIYGSDYMIKEVLAYDYAVGKGRALLADNTAQTLILATSDHECGGFAVVGLHDEGDLQKNGTKIRTYANTPKKPVFTPTPVNITRGDRATNGWFPDYTMVDFQGYMWPKVGPSGRRIVVSYGSNPVTNGNGDALGGTPGNHTPQDILTYADDNVNGTFASRITGHGLMDNTDIAPIMEDFLGVNIFGGSVGIDNPTQGTHGTDGDAVMPNPVRSGAMAAVDFTTSGGGMATVEIFNSIGQRVRRLLNENLPAGVHHTEWNTADEHGAPVPSDTYMVVVRSGGDVVSRKLVVVR